ncbi:unnamed protein product [Mycetohabitans rhizoxinica HKI 454]|uniref:Uncharacterized protein n=1 Tax=Mycetohabitans rhizoxinica (strain DSM 19002 / CIP 109453 / HKI 454) TaxID=882378 RepID=E5AKH9_MYCRK|nr:unnamed protein product [Mycetohabitans rhizoxinica HKI 454]
MISMLRAIDLSTTMGAVNGRTAPAARLLMQLSVSSCHYAVVVQPAAAQQQSPARGDVGE